MDHEIHKTKLITSIIRGASELSHDNACHSVIYHKTHPIQRKEGRTQLVSAYTVEMGSSGDVHGPCTANAEIPSRTSSWGSDNRCSSHSYSPRPRQHYNHEGPSPGPLHHLFHTSASVGDVIQCPPYALCCSAIIDARETQNPAPIRISNSFKKETELERWSHPPMAMCTQLMRADLSGFASPLFNLRPQCQHRSSQQRCGSYFGPLSKIKTSSHGGGRLAVVLTGGRSRSVETSLQAMGQVSESLTGQDEARASTVAEKDLLVVGPGVLGRLIAQYWLQKFEGSKVVGLTRTNTHHEELRSLGIVPAVKDDQGTDKYPYVVFCAPPYGNEDYGAEVRAAAQRWNGKGSLLFTSASSVFDVSDNGPCEEGVAPVVAKGVSPRTDRLLYAEEEVLKVGGNVVRLAGLYTSDRGAHTYWLKVGTVDARPDHIINLIHYEDAASLCVAALKAGTSKQVFIGCDGSPISRQEIMEAATKSGKFEGEFKGFTTTSGPLGKRMNNSITRETLNWKPKYSSFAKFFEDL